MIFVDFSGLQRLGKTFHKILVYGSKNPTDTDRIDPPKSWASKYSRIFPVDEDPMATSDSSIHFLENASHDFFFFRSLMTPMYPAQLFSSSGRSSCRNMDLKLVQRQGIIFDFHPSWGESTLMHTCVVNLREISLKNIALFGLVS